MFKIELTEEQVQRTLNILAEQPLKDVFDLVVVFKNQVENQMQEIENKQMAEQEEYLEFLRAKEDARLKTEELAKQIEEKGFVDLTESQK